MLCRKPLSSLPGREGAIHAQFEDFVERTQKARTVDKLRACFERAMLDDGYENNIFATVSRGSVDAINWHRFPSGFLETYLQQRWHHVDPTIGYALLAVRPFHWRNVARDTHLSREQLDFLKDAKRMGVEAPVIVPFAGPGGRREVVTFGERRSGAADPARIPILQAMCSQTWCRYADLTGRSLTGEHDVQDLTSKELDILQWIKHGKSNAEIAEILPLSVKTIEYHVGNILRKLGAANRTTAVVIAIRHCLLAL